MESLVTTLQTRYMLGGLPSYRQTFCRNANAFGESCDRCVRLCPEQVFPAGKNKKPDFSRCSRCGVCAAVCPSAAIAPIDVRVRTFLMALAREGELSAGCERDEENWTLSLSCLAALGWEAIACAALLRGVTVSLRQCGGCERTDCAAQIIETLDSVRRFLGEEVFLDRVQILLEGDGFAPRGVGISRRELFTMFWRMPLDTALNLLPELKKTERGALLLRALLRDLVKQRYDSLPKETRPRYKVRLPRFGESCYACGSCVRQCPEKALEIRPSADGATFAVTVEVWKCSGCGVCTKMCREGALGGMAEMAVPHLGTVLLRRNPRSVCAACGKVIRQNVPDGLCDVCRPRQKPAAVGET